MNPQKSASAAFAAYISARKEPVALKFQYGWDAHEVWRRFFKEPRERRTAMSATETSFSAQDVAINKWRGRTSQ